LIQLFLHGFYRTSAAHYIMFDQRTQMVFLHKVLVLYALFSDYEAVHAQKQPALLNRAAQKPESFERDADFAVRR